MDTIQGKLNRAFSHFGLNTFWVQEFSKWNPNPLEKRKIKHNNKTGLNTYKSDSVHYKLIQKKSKPSGYKCSVQNEEQRNVIAGSLYLFGICATQTTRPENYIYLEFSDAAKFISITEKARKCAWLPIY